ncbi:hypothetical protein [Mesorhizobium sp. INR15]|uniref:hypothetical protein n=1 Tax=Mesorhizobium sp. INR15 TaxID=2654248 RepID=UPI0018965557|nr:hypothetical protein [Mesorhizobium sp. INR15]QPC93275.1 hypothetical protein GA829_23390 [Mesorhizobium sp. INR15]
MALKSAADPNLIVGKAPIVRAGGSIAHSCRLARHLAECLGKYPAFQLKAPVALNIVCFGIRGASAEFVRNLVLDLQESGSAAPSWTTLRSSNVYGCVP